MQFFVSQARRRSGSVLVLHLMFSTTCCGQNFIVFGLHFLLVLILQEIVAPVLYQNVPDLLLPLLI